MSTLILDKVLSGYNLAKVNDNFERIEKAFNEALLHRDGSKELLDDLDVNSQKLLNVGGIEIGGVDIVESIASLQEEYNAYVSTMNEYKSAVDEILEEAISYGAVDQKSIGNAQRVFTTSQAYAVNSNMTLPLPYIVGKNTLKLNLGHYYELYKGVDYEEVGVVGNQSTTIKLLRAISSGVEIEEFVDGDNDLYSIYSTAEALQELLTTSYSPESIEEFVNSVSDIQELGLEDKIAQLNSLYDSLVSLRTALQTTVADINTKYSTITDMYEDIGTKYSLLETLYPQLLALISDTDFDLDELNDAVGEINTAISDLNDLTPVIEGYKDDAETAATSAESSASSASTSATSAANSASSAAGSLTNAQIWAEGTDGQVGTLGGEHSSKRWALRASAILSDSEITSEEANTPRSLAERFADVINVKDFGAKGNGSVVSAGDGGNPPTYTSSADESSVIQAAMNKAMSSGKILFFPPGIYRIDTPLAMTSGIRIVGSGEGKTILFAGTKNNSILTVYGTGTGIENMVTYYSIEELCFCTNQNNSYSSTLESSIESNGFDSIKPLIDFQDCYHGVIKDCLFIGRGRHIQGHNFWDTRFRNCDFQNGGAWDNSDFTDYKQSILSQSMPQQPYNCPVVYFKHSLSGEPSRTVNNIYFEGCRFEAFKNSAVQAQPVSGNAASNILFTSCKFESHADKYNSYLLMPGCYNTSVLGCQFICTARLKIPAIYLGGSAANFQSAISVSNGEVENSLIYLPSTLTGSYIGITPAVYLKKTSVINPNHEEGQYRNSVSDSVTIVSSNDISTVLSNNTVVLNGDSSDFNFLTTDYSLPASPVEAWEVKNNVSIVESGTNYKRYSDGTMECWGSGTTSSTPAAIDFPKTFSEVPVVVISGKSSSVDMQMRLYKAAAVSASSFTPVATNITATSFSAIVYQYIARGKWSA